jgi:adenine-specific DNA glycosylase
MKKKRKTEKEKFDHASVLMRKTKHEIVTMLREMKKMQAGFFSFPQIKPLITQYDLFSYLPEDNTVLARACIDSLVETL